jgi:beta-lactamase regulating signal transducer with metallopeptidase domain
MPFMLMADPIQAGFAGAGGAMPAAFAAFAQAAAPVAVSALWQGAAVAIALVLSLRLSPRVSAAHRFAAWAAGFAVVAGLPFLPLLAHSSAVGAFAPLDHAAARPWLSLDSRWAFAIAALWLIASAFRLGQLVFHSLRLRKLWKAAAPVQAEASLRALLASPSAPRAVQICTTRDLDRPSVIGFLAPRILIPEWLFSRLTPGELEQVVLHEAEHLRRRDDWSNLLQKLSLVLFPLNPTLVWMERRLCREREMACDEGVVRRTQAPRSYAACLTTLAERGLQRRVQALSLGAFERRPELVHRVHSILRRRQALNPVAARALMGVLGCGLVVGSVELARSPQLVAFVAPRPDTQIAALALLQPSESIAPVTAMHASPQVRAINTKAILPPTRNQAAAPAAPASVAPDAERGDAERPADAAPTMAASRDTNNGAPRAQFVKAVMPDSASAAPQGREYIVFAAWEQVETASARSRAMADYDSGETPQAQIGAAAGEPDSSRAAQVTVTRLILLVYPVGSAPVSSAPGANAAHATGSHSNRQAAPAIENGWPAFQL